jgi:glyceraldehyde 3-phosphate dehydrogenase
VLDEFLIANEIDDNFIPRDLILKAKSGINGFGRMGRLAMRAGWEEDSFAFPQINEIAGDAACSAHLLMFDSVHGTWDQPCEAQGSDLIKSRNINHRLVRL